MSNPNPLLKQHIAKVYKQRFDNHRSMFYCQYHLLWACEYRCNHCYLGDLWGWEAKLPPLEEVRKSLRRIANAALHLNLTPWVDFTGGDPLLRKDFESIASSAKELGIGFGIKANPDLITYSLIQKLRDLGIGYFQLSLDGLETTHDSIRRSPGAFKKAIGAIEKIKNMNCVVFIQYTASARNYGEIIPLVNFLIERGLIVDGFSWARYWTDNESNKGEMLSKSQVIGLFRTLLDYYEHLFSTTSFFIKDDNGQFVPKIFFGFKEHLWYPFLSQRDYIDPQLADILNQSPNSINCSATKHFYVIDPEGSVYRCRRIKESFIGNLYQNSSFLDLIDGDLSVQFKEQLSSNQCGNCHFYNACGGCAAIQKAQKGSIINSDPDCSEYPV